MVTPIVGKQIAKDALAIKDSLRECENEWLALILFPISALGNHKEADTYSPIQRLTEKQYITRMMIGGVWGKFLWNAASGVLFTLCVIPGFAIYSIIGLFRGIFSTK